jgi:hypothetical protein
VAQPTPYWADRASAALARELNSLRKDSAVLILLARSVLEDLVMRHINTTLYVMMSRIIPTPLIPNYMEKLEVISCVRGVKGPPCGVPSADGLTKLFSITPALRNARRSLSTRLSRTLLAASP